ncbi:MAG: bifunctional 4-hydroxy-2-oxoglutarate aldolase/2-dehydro-3-deoxy-phosphogluconate aldolase [Victivallales bacterium]|nr:bifunctional 4-hydroxy-2-oxoglutarate aldolase/2-dehydro-3-deoxy-phosphogluconate aldolase [Victivallales bacterium]
MTKAFEMIKKEKFIALARHVPPAAIPDLASALLKGGVKILEITFDPCDPDTVANTAEAISLANAAGMLTGAGTVLNVEMVDAAFNAGAEFIISPNTDREVIERTKELGLLSIPGAYTPSEIVCAFKFGADIVKIFPVLPHQTDYVKVVSSPLAHIPFMVTGGVNQDTAADFLNAGAMIVAAGASIIKPELVAQKNWAEISRLAAKHVAAIKNGVS